MYKMRGFFERVLVFFAINQKIDHCIYLEHVVCQFTVAVLPPAGKCDRPVIRLNVHLNTWHWFYRLKVTVKLMNYEIWHSLTPDGN